MVHVMLSVAKDLDPGKVRDPPCGSRWHGSRL